MQPYQNLIMDLLTGETPRQKYETLLSLIEDSLVLKKCESAKFRDGIKQSILIIRDAMNQLNQNIDKVKNYAEIISDLQNKLDEKL